LRPSARYTSNISTTHPFIQLVCPNEKKNILPMKLNTALTSLLIWPTILFSQSAILNESFNSGIPVGWYGYSQEGASWKINDTLDADHSQCLWARDTAVGQAWIRPEPLNLNQLSSLKLTFNLALIAFASTSPNLLLKYRTDSQAPNEWIDLTSWGGNNAENPINFTTNSTGLLKKDNVNWVEVTYDLDNIVGELDSVRLWFGADIQVGGGWVLLDNINLVGVPFTTNINELQKTSFQVYPNPANEVINIETDYPWPISVEIYDLLGRKLEDFKVSKDKLNSIDTSDLSRGIYLIKITESNGLSSVKQFVIKR
jgi:hypothetical protein